MKKSCDLKIKSSGFSLIEVLVAVVVLAFGLLALVNLQVSLIRASAESKAQSTGLQLAKDKLEDLRTYQTLAGYQALSSGNDTITDNGGSLGGVTFNRSWTVTRYAFNKVANQFQQVGTLTGATPAGFESDNEYKKVAISVTWTDPTGAQQSIGLEDAIGAINPGDTTRLVRANSGAQPRRPIVLIHDPSGTPGVIPIAVGDGSNTAATNPKPVIAGKDNKVVETRFDVLTYSGLSGGVGRAQARVETAVVGCTCDFGAAPASSSARGFRPTYWNGFRYTPPEETDYVPPAGAASLPNNAPPQSSRCTACCRDHHDPGSLGAADAKFDPRRASHQHYRLEGGSLVPAMTGQYLEACRLIRVDGFYRVAADMYNDYFGLIETLNDGSSLEFAPTSSATTNYTNFVLDYLGQRIVSNASPGTFNTPLDSATVSSLETSRNLNAPSNININATNGSKWLHSRGLFIDYLEPEARDKILEAKSNCDPSASVSGCVLPYVPFTSINLTEIAEWSPISGQQIVVVNNDFSQSGATSQPARGNVRNGSSPTVGTEVNAVASLRASNSGVALLPDAIDVDEGSLLTDQQKFTLVGAAASGGSYTVTFSGYTFGSSTATYPTIQASPSAVCNYATQGGSRPNPYTCTASQVGVPTMLTVGNYNYEFDQGGLTLTCTKADGTDPLSYTAKQNETVKICRNFRVASVSGGGLINAPSPSDGVRAETTPISFANIADGAAVTIGMALQGDTLAPYTCTYSQLQGGAPKNPVITSQSCP